MTGKQPIEMPTPPPWSLYDDGDFYRVLAGIVFVISIVILVALSNKPDGLNDQLHRCYERQQVSVERCNQMHEIVVQWQEMTKP